MQKEVLIRCKDLSKHFVVGRKQVLKAVNGINLEVYRGETLGLVGESGCGKSTLGRVLSRIYQPSSGSYQYEGQEVSRVRGRNVLAFAKKLQMVFQDPYASLNPRMTVGNIIGEGIDIHKMYTGEARNRRIYELLELVGLNAEHANRFPHEFSGGQRQRIVIARALAIEPECIICDEPISALDVSIQAQIINLLKRLQNEMSLTYLFIAHDLNVVKYISDRVAVMYLGYVVEISPSARLYTDPLHPYTKALLSAIPMPDPELERKKQRIMLAGDVPSPIDLPPGCVFASRCPYVTDACRKEMPRLVDAGNDHQVAC
ncbi:MAG: ATP-binding cassette domain-containing protein, partial [Eubacteriales bacterium]|nr:ATP-binding cassette domain-containing protein [Eubacteriales bacterium]